MKRARLMVSLELLHEFLDLPGDVLIAAVNQTTGDVRRNMFSVHVVGDGNCGCLPTAGEGEYAMIVSSVNLHDRDSWWRQ